MDMIISKQIAKSLSTNIPIYRFTTLIVIWRWFDFFTFSIDVCSQNDQLN